MISATALMIDAKDLQTRFVAFLPRIERRARIAFRGVQCATRRADCIAETVAIAWKWFCRLMRRGKDATKFIGALAVLAVRAVRSGRRASGQIRSNDVLNPVAQCRHGFVVHSLSAGRNSDETTRERWLQTVLQERLADNTTTPPPEQAAFRLDFGCWVRRLSPRERRILRAMSRNEPTKDLSRQFHVSAGRISQMRREFHLGWSRFVGDDVVAA